jgi:ADP-ribose pyrophosphatase YjhB (NUDIX family)
MPVSVSSIRSAGAVVLRLDAAGELEALLVGGTPHEPDHWSFPKGHLEIGEGWEAAALREVQEETGLIVELLALVGVNTYPVAVNGHPIAKAVRLFIARTVGGNLSERDAERLEAAWFPIADAEHLLKYEADRAILRESERIFSLNPLYQDLIAEGP